MDKVYSMKIDETVYNTLKALCSAKGISIKDGLRQAIGLLLADNLTNITIVLQKETTTPKGDGSKQS